MACHTQSGLIGSASIIVVARKRRRDARVAGAGCGDPYVEFRRYGSVLRELERREPINRGRYHIQVLSDGQRALTVANSTA
jgi:small ligand-binding sensory domain FIST